MKDEEKQEKTVEVDILALNEDEVIGKIGEFSSEKLADIIIMHRYLGIYASIASAAMIELATRRENGETFEYELYINEKLVEMPKITINLSQYSNILNAFKGFGGFGVR